jgi:hypothetical protein
MTFNSNSGASNVKERSMQTYSSWIAIMICTTVLTASAVKAQAILLDDFNNGIDPRWFPLDTNYNLDAMGMPISPKPWGPGIFDASSGALNLHTTGPEPPNPALPPGPTVFDTLNSGLLGVGWGPSAADPTFSNGRLRATVRVDNPSNVDLILRANPVTLSAYVFAALGSYGEFHFSRLDNGLIAFSVPVPSLTFSQGEDWVMEFGAVGNQFLMKAWKVGDPEPAAPQFTAVDNAYAFGALGVSASVFTNNISAPTQVDATIDDVYFMHIPEPSSVILGVVAAVVLCSFSALVRSLRGGI